MNISVIIKDMLSTAKNTILSGFTRIIHIYISQSNPMASTPTINNHLARSWRTLVESHLISLIPRLLLLQLPRMTRVLRLYRKSPNRSATSPKALSQSGTSCRSHDNSGWDEPPGTSQQWKECTMEKPYVHRRLMTRWTSQTCERDR